MTKSTRSFIFTVCTMILNIAMTLAIILFLVVLFFVPFFIIGKTPTSDNFIIQAGLPVIIVLGLIISLKLFTATTAGIIKLFHLENKLDEKIIRRYSKENRF